MKILLLILKSRLPLPNSGMLLLLLLLTLTTNYVDGQQIINAGPDQSIPCGTTAALTATISPTQSTTAYTISTAAYNPDPYNQGTLVTQSQIITGTFDDGATGAKPIGFSFCYFGNTYTNFYIGTNNWISFSPGQNITYVTTSIPNSSGAAPRNSILGPWQDINPSTGGTIRYAVYGTAPYRRLVISYYNVPMYSCSGLLYSSQIKIYETTNIIETHIANKPLCTSWNNGRAVHGLLNSNGSVAVTVPGRNNTQWTVSNECRRFTPSGAPAYTVDWLDANNTVVGTGTSINVTPLAPTNYTARLTLTCGNTQFTDQVLVSVPNYPTPAFSLSSNTVCAGDVVTVTYNGTATQAATYNWNFSGATIISGSGRGPYQIQWANAGTQNVTLSVTENGCTSAIGGLPVTVNALPTATFTAPASVCNPDTVQISFTGNTLPSAVYNWNFAGGNVISGSNAGPYTVYWPTTGAKNVTLNISQNGCNATPASNVVNVYNTPTAFFTPVSGVCENSATSITYNGNATSGATYNWNFNGGSVVSGSGQGPYQIAWANAGNYDVTLSVSENGCNSPAITNAVTVNDIPVAAYTSPATLCLPDTALITFTGNGNVDATYNWGFSGGTIISGSGQGPYSVVWSTPGAKAISLTVTQSGCISNTQNTTTTVYAVPTANFSIAPSVCQGAELIANYTGTATTGATYTWTFNSAQINSGANQGPYAIQWNNAGNYTTTLSVTENGCTSPLVSKQVVVNQMPTSLFNVQSPLCENQTGIIQYAGNASAAANYTWNFDAGVVQSGSANGPYSVLWAAAGTKNISLTVSENGCTSTQTNAVVNVDTLPRVNAGTDVSFCSGSVANLGVLPNTGFNYSWYPTNGLSDANIANPTVSLTNYTGSPIVYQYVVTVNNNAGSCSNFDTVFVTVNPEPVVSFATPAGQCLDNNSFQITPTGTFSANARFDWYANYTTTPTFNSAPVNHVFSTPGWHPISVTVTDNGCSSATFTDSVEVYAMPVANFSGNNLSGCLPFKAQFMDMSTSSTPIANYAWDLGASTSSDASPYYIYTKAGIHDISLTITDANGCTSSITIPAYVNANPVPVADFVATPDEVDVVFNPYTDIVDMSTGGTSYWYDFGDGNSMATANGQHRYADTGTYVITQIVTNQFGCADTSFRTVVAKPSHTFYIPNAFTPNADGVNDIFEPKGFEIENYTMNIFNRWGQLVFSTNDIKRGWDGSFNGIACEEGVYTWRSVYQSNAKNSDGRQVKEGIVTLLR